MFASEIKRQRTHAALAEFFLHIGVNEIHFPVVANRAAQQLELLTQLLRNMKLRHVGSARLQPLAALSRRCGGNLCNRRQRGGAQLRAASPLDHARAEGERFNLFNVKHERRQLKASAQTITHARFAFNRRSGDRQIANVAVDGSLADLQPFGQLRQ